MKPRAIMVSVNYSDALSVTLPYNAHHFSEICVVTTPSEEPAVTKAAQGLASYIYYTDAFFRHGAIFNKFLALEEALDAYGRHGTLAILDADVMWPKDAKLPPIECGKLYSPRRRMFPVVPKSLADVPPESEWKRYPLFEDYEFAGYTQLFDAADPVLGQPPWHETNWTTAGGPDSWFQMKWAPENKVRPDFEVLHLGECGVNWAGRATPYADGTRDPKAAERLGELAKILTIRANTPGPTKFDHEKIR